MAESRITQLTHAGMTFDVIDSGPLDGPPVVLLHGFPQRATSWAKVSEQLNAEGLRTYALDQRGYSPGARPTSRFAYGLGELVGDVTALIHLIGRPVHLVGHDWGSAVAWAVAGGHPELVRTLTAVSVAHPTAFMKSMVSSSQPLRSYYMLLFQLPVLPERLLSTPNGLGEKMLRAAGMDSDMIETFRRDIVADGALPGGLGYYRSIVLGGKEVGRKVSVPTTYVWSDQDAALARRGAELTADYVTAPYELVVVRGATHWLLDQNAPELAEIIVERVRSV
ncbi:alpha/beta fold hydrolase [Aeromicrobium sp. SMF47]|uniref:Alpha/beta fold hydrolase n=1 Tax=Aeromicrobium yanjiei TaxID=2662028 RepID=A0A5Q2MK20_9ACTN|nr:MULTISPECIES: alpha/beta fold hydrolase [Aeromicrobium]MRJ76813.1 alpha/beta fold hydrolase [Aeromicrobium yanjiei]MRK01157.1 alpha/beta fold hydrolase [Aeromicrobium sp. S22]QGG42053.1 alpha/beta fold hydrolase [Aeromicrobium yanjiei]